MTHDPSKSLGERLYEAVLATEAAISPVPWRELAPGVQARMEKAAVTFTATLSDAPKGPKIGDVKIDANGHRWRLYERELEGDKWECLGPPPPKDPTHDQ